MRAAVLAIAALSTALVAMPAQAEPVALKPSSPWNVDFGENKCRLARIFGEGENKHVLFIEQYSPGDGFGLTTAGPAFKKFRSLQSTAVRFSEGQEELRAKPFAGSVEGYGTAIIFSGLGVTEGESSPKVADEPLRQDFAQLDTTIGAQVRFLEVRQNAREVRLETGPLDQVFTVMNQCTLDLLRDWGLDPKRHLTAKNQPRWINRVALARRIMADYPDEALEAGEQGIMRMRVIVTAEGAVESCTILKATETKKLESPACKVMKAAQFEPARDADGQPFRSYSLVGLNYRAN